MESRQGMITVDTHVIILEALDPQSLSKKALQQFRKANESDGIIFCDISFWEISMLIGKKRLIIDVPYKEFISLLMRTRNYIVQAITPEIADIANNMLKSLDSDPADRLIAATSLFTNTSLVTADQNMRRSKILRTVW